MKMKPSYGLLPQCRLVLGLILLAFGAFASASEQASHLPTHTPSESAANDAFSPYANRTYPTQVFWGDTHLHTGMSFDAGAFGARLMPDDAYRFAKGNQLTSTTGYPVRLSRPLDFLVVADHSDNMGFFPQLRAGNPTMLADPSGQRWYDMIQEGGQVAVEAAVEIIVTMLTESGLPEALTFQPDSDDYAAAWQTTIEAAEAHNEPGRFTAFIGYEWTSTDNGMNLHRVVLYRDGADKAGAMPPYTALPPYGSPDPRNLWRWLQRYEDETGGQVLAIAHNGNLSNGHMFPTSQPLYGEPLDRDYAERRARWEPLYEITQIKGDGETHPLLSPDDEFADYETWDKGNLDLSEVKTNDMLIGEYGRAALQLGLQIEQRVGVNPYKFGFIGATDSHTALATAAEDNFFGKHSGTEPSPARLSTPMAKTSNMEWSGWATVASGYQGVWARENTREALFDAMMRKETYATTGPRMVLRFFGGWDFEPSDIYQRSLADVGYRKGVPMGGDLPAPPATGDSVDGEDSEDSAGAVAPSFLIAAQRDPYSGNLDRIQVVKGWLNADGEREEKVYDVQWSGERKPDAAGKLPAVGNTVDVATATWENSIGAPELATVWRDPDFDPTQPAVYYARVLEIPTPRWSTIEAVRFGVEIPDEAPLTTQERAYTSAIWYTPPAP